MTSKSKPARKRRPSSKRATDSELVREIVETVKTRLRPKTIVMSPRARLERWIVTGRQENDDHD